MSLEQEQQEIVDRLITALKGGQFVLYAQAIRPINPSSGLAVHQEILVRFLEEEQKLLPPGGFFPALERHNLMGTMDKWVVFSVIRWLATAGKDTGTHCTVNLSSDSIVDPGFADFVARQLTKHKVRPQRLLFEISEEDANTYALSLDPFVLALKPLGCGFVVTDYSGERVAADMLQALGVGLVKIAGDIVLKLHSDPKILGNAARLHKACRDIGIRTIAELVERRETLDALRVIGVDYAQGYGIGKPAPLA